MKLLEIIKKSTKIKTNYVSMLSGRYSKTVYKIDSDLVLSTSYSTENITSGTYKGVSFKIPVEQQKNIRNTVRRRERFLHKKLTKELFGE